MFRDLMNAVMYFLKTIWQNERDRKSLYVSESLFFCTYRLRCKGTLRLFSLAGYEIHWWSDVKLEDVNRLLNELSAAFNRKEAITNLFIGEKECVISNVGDEVYLNIFFKPKIGFFQIGPMITVESKIDRERLEHACIAVEALIHGSNLPVSI